MQYHAIPCNTMQYHGTLITADGAYHCPVGSIMAIFYDTVSNQSKDKMVKQFNLNPNIFIYNGFPGLQTSDLDVYKRGQRSKPSKKHSSLLQRIGPKVSTNGLVTDGGGDGSRNGWRMFEFQ